jgi:hypothetical protein
MWCLLVNSDPPPPPPLILAYHPPPPPSYSTCHLCLLPFLPLTHVLHSHHPLACPLPTFTTHLSPPDMCLPLPLHVTFACPFPTLPITFSSFHLPTPVPLLSFSPLTIIVIYPPTYYPFASTSFLLSPSPLHFYTSTSPSVAAHVSPGHRSSATPFHMAPIHAWFLFI